MFWWCTFDLTLEIVEVFCHTDLPMSLWSKSVTIFLGENSISVTSLLNIGRMSFSEISVRECICNGKNNQQLGVFYITNEYIASIYNIHVHCIANI